jgi:hypothetical protein
MMKSLYSIEKSCQELRLFHYLINLMFQITLYSNFPHVPNNEMLKLTTCSDLPLPISPMFYRLYPNLISYDVQTYAFFN